MENTTTPQENPITPPSPSMTDQYPASDLRTRAEAQYQQNNNSWDSLSPVDTQRLIHELGVHQIELEMQNEELHHTRDELEARLDYINLFNFAPVGYFTMGRNGTIRKVNITGELLLNDKHFRLVGGRFGFFVKETERHVFNTFLEKVFSTHIIQSCELPLEKEGNDLIWVNIEGIVKKNEEECLVTLHDITARKQMEADLIDLNARLEKRVIDHTMELQLANRALTDAQETERRSLALELHDELGQVLNVIKLTLDMVSTMDQQNGLKQVDSARVLLRTLIDRVRRISLDLRPSMLDDLGLLPSLEWLFSSYNEQTGFQVNFKVENLEQRFPPRLEINAYRIVQEALTNIIRHSGDKNAFVEVSANKQTLHIKISDHGNGFDINHIDKKRATGLSGMRERARQIGGELTIDTHVGQGTVILAALPIKSQTGSLIGAPLQ